MANINADSRGRVNLSGFTEPRRYYRASVSPSGVVTLEPVTAYTDAELAALRAFNGEEK